MKYSRFLQWWSFARQQFSSWVFQVFPQWNKMGPGNWQREKQTLFILYIDEEADLYMTTLDLHMLGHLNLICRLVSTLRVSRTQWISRNHNSLKKLKKLGRAEFQGAIGMLIYQLIVIDRTHITIYTYRQRLWVYYFYYYWKYYEVVHPLAWHNVETLNTEASVDTNISIWHNVPDWHSIKDFNFLMLDIALHIFTLICYEHINRKLKCDQDLESKKK